MQDKGALKKGQVGETLTWVVATIIIVVIVIFFIFGASLLGGTKSIGDFRASLTSSTSYVGDAPFLKKSLFTYATLGASVKRFDIDKALTTMANDGDFNLDYNKTKAEILLLYNNKK